ncbi:hypothetical protein CR513_18550, partial [Mucuna pruriens]
MFKTKLGQDLPLRIKLKFLFFLKLNRKAYMMLFWIKLDRSHARRARPSLYLKISPSLEQNGFSKINLMLVAQSQHKGIDFIETFILVAILETTSNECQMCILNGIINEEVYVKHPPSFESDIFINHVFKLKKAFYGLKQSPCAWYEKLSSFLFENGLKEEKYTQLFFAKAITHFIIIQIYVDDIIIEAIDGVSKLMQKEFEMSMMGELKYFLGLQIKQAKDGIFIHQT